jgi:hypothetical protein
MARTVRFFVFVCLPRGYVLRTIFDHLNSQPNFAGFSAQTSNIEALLPNIGALLTNMTAVLTNMVAVLTNMTAVSTNMTAVLTNIAQPTFF